MQLWNKLSKEELVEKLKERGTKFVTVSFYQYASIPNPQVFRDHLFQMWDNLGIVGRRYVATEGINAQIGVPADKFEQFKKELYEISILNNIRLNIAVDEAEVDRKSTRLNSSHVRISYAVF